MRSFAHAILSRQFENLPPSGVDAEEWDIAKEWSSALVAHGVQTPSLMKGLDNLRRLSSFRNPALPGVTVLSISIKKACLSLNWFKTEGA
jgi:hypothetical protein